MQKQRDLRPKCIRCGELWLQPEGVDAGVTPCSRCQSKYRLVILESPYAGDVDKNVAYALAALRDSLLRGEAPLASHLLYTQQGVIDDTDVNQRRLGIEAGLAWVKRADATVVYVDRGVSKGMHQGIQRALLADRPVLIRSLGDPWSDNEPFEAHGLEELLKR